jgi:hypothetical protein
MNQNSSELNRRAFLRLLVIGAAGAGLASCIHIAPVNVEVTMPATAVAEAEYYLERTEQFLKEFDTYWPSFAAALAKRYPADAIQAIQAETRQAYAGLIPQLPYIGGEANMLTSNLVQSAWGLALYRTLQQRGDSAKEVGRLLYRAVENMMQAAVSDAATPEAPEVLRAWLLNSLKAAAQQSQKRRYPGDWVFTVVEGNGQNFDYGIDYTECGVCKFFQAQHAAELTPYMCLLDFPMSEAMGDGLVRTMTLANGDPKCDFRYKRDRPTQPVLPADFLPEDS